MATSYCRSPARVGGINLLHEYETPLKSIPTYHSEARYPVERRGSLRQSKQTTMLVAVFLAVLACLQCYRMYRTYEISVVEVSSGISSQQAPGVSQRALRSILEQQISEKDIEISVLRAQLDQAIQNNKLKDTNMQAQEALIKKLQERHEAEKLGRSRAQLALAEKTTSLHGCFVDKEKLQAASEKCSASLMAAAGQQQQAPAATAA